MTIPLIVAIIGLAVWFIATRPNTSNGWVADVSRICFAAGLLAYLFSVAGEKVFG